MKYRFNLVQMKTDRVCVVNVLGSEIDIDCNVKNVKMSIILYKQYQGLWGPKSLGETYIFSLLK